MLRLDSLLKITLMNKRRYPDREPNNRIGDVSWKDESLSTIFYVDKSTSEEMASYSSAAPENHDILDGPLSNRHFNHWEMGSSSLKSTKQRNISGHGLYFQYIPM